MQNYSLITLYTGEDSSRQLSSHSGPNLPKLVRLCVLNQLALGTYGYLGTSGYLGTKVGTEVQPLPYTFAQMQKAWEAHGTKAISAMKSS